MALSNHCIKWAALLLAFAGTARAEHVNEWLPHAAQAPTGVPDKVIGNEVLYQVFVDRFANGNSGNDCLDGERFCDRSHNDWYKFWGGDLRGLVDKLPYLKELGVTRLWLTPIFDNQMVTVSRFRFGRDAQVTAYHGYWIRDWYRLNPYFTDRGKQDYDLVQELVTKAQPEIRILLDTVTNHTNPSDPTQWSLDYVTSKEPLPRGDGVDRTHRGALFRDGVYVTSYDEDENLPDAERRFHHFGFITDYTNQFQVENYQLDGLSDLDQKNTVIADYMRDAHAFWLRKIPGLAGYRMDTIKHVPQDYWRRFDRELRAAAPSAEVVGEYYGAGPTNDGSKTYYRETSNTMFDFDFRNTVQAVFQRGQSMRLFPRLWEKDPVLGDARPLVTFIDNHDLPRMRGQGLTAQRMYQALALMFMARGIPCVYYGLEQDLFYPGDPGDPYNRPMMARFDTNGPLYKLMRTLAALRHGNPALRYGKTHVVHESDHILAFERVGDDGRRAFFATSINPVGNPDRFDLQGLTFPDGTYRDPVSGREYQVRGGRMPVALANGDVIVLSDRP